MSFNNAVLRVTTVSDKAPYPDASYSHEQPSPYGSNESAAIFYWNLHQRGALHKQVYGDTEGLSHIYDAIARKESSRVYFQENLQPTDIAVKNLIAAKQSAKQILPIFIEKHCEGKG